MKIAFLGGGNMASALLAGVLSSGVARKEEVEVVEISSERRAWLAEKFSVAAVPDGAAAVAASDIAVLAVKPQNAPELLAQLAPVLGGSKLLLSIAAGLSTATLERAVAARVVRAMPNLAATVGKAVSALCAGTRATEEDLDAAEAVLRGAGEVVRVEERMMDAVTGVSGSGPGYLFRFIEALEEAARAEGFEADVARKLAVWTAYGAAATAIESGEAPARLREKVSSKGGTTLAGLAAMERRGFAEAVKAAVRAATMRSAELNRG
ncbi:MAG: pyrroline-5-carboxylate reductase [Kiritimatiellae bacterium]|nr:pyrroline-5-carboxylate reductase [Kiritimatiellia bacterium]